MPSLAQTQPQVTHKFFNGSMRPVALIPPYITTRRQAMDELGLPRTTAYNALKRGWYLLDQGRRLVNPGGTFDPEEAYLIARAVFRKYFKSKLPAIFEPQDLIQEAVLRLLELSGDERFETTKFKWGYCRTAMRSALLTAYRRRGHEEELVEANVRISGKPDTWAKKNLAEDFLLALVDERMAA
jgi:hypothetical protein